MKSFKVFSEATNTKMTKAKFIKAARAAAPHVTAQIEWLEDQDYGDYDRAWLQALNALEKEQSALWDKLESLKKHQSALERDKTTALAAMAALDNAFQTARDERWDMSDLKNQITVYTMATDEDTIRELMY